MYKGAQVLGLQPANLQFTKHEHLYGYFQVFCSYIFLGISIFSSTSSRLLLILINCQRTLLFLFYFALSHLYKGKLVFIYLPFSFNTNKI